MHLFEAQKQAVEILISCDKKLIIIISFINKYNIIQTNSINPT
jgi:hypothetical protein